MVYAVVPGSQWYTAKNIFTVSQALVIVVGRFAGPPVARMVTGLGGRDAYAALQLGVALFSVLSCIKLASLLRVLLARETAAQSTSTPPHTPPNSESNQ